MLFTPGSPIAEPPRARTPARNPCMARKSTVFAAGRSAPSSARRQVAPPGCGRSCLALHHRLGGSASAQRRVRQGGDPHRGGANVRGGRGEVLREGPSRRARHATLRASWHGATLSAVGTRWLRGARWTPGRTMGSGGARWDPGAHSGFGGAGRAGSGVVPSVRRSGDPVRWAAGDDHAGCGADRGRAANLTGQRDMT